MVDFSYCPDLMDAYYWRNNVLSHPGTRQDVSNDIIAELE
jgi:hypothetical protein